VKYLIPPETLDPLDTVSYLDSNVSATPDTPETVETVETVETLETVNYLGSNLSATPETLETESHLNSTYLCSLAPFLCAFKGALIVPSRS